MHGPWPTIIAPTGVEPSVVIGLTQAEANGAGNGTQYDAAAKEEAASEGSSTAGENGDLAIMKHGLRYFAIPQKDFAVLPLSNWTQPLECSFTNLLPNLIILLFPPHFSSRFTPILIPSFLPQFTRARSPSFHGEQRDRDETETLEQARRKKGSSAAVVTGSPPTQSSPRSQPNEPRVGAAARVGGRRRARAAARVASRRRARAAARVGEAARRAGAAAPQI